MKRTGHIFFTVWIVCALVNLAFAQDKANWSGNWKMIPAQSRFADAPPDSLTLNLNLKQDSLSETVTYTTGNNKRSFSVTTTTDGKTETKEVMGRSVQATVKWEANALIIRFVDDRGEFSQQLTMSDDSKTLTLIIRQSSANGEKEDTIVLEKAG